MNPLQNKSMDYRKGKKVARDLQIAENDFVLKSHAVTRLAAGASAMTARDDMLSQMSQITDERSHGLYHKRISKKHAQTQERTKQLVSPISTQR